MNNSRRRALSGLAAAAAVAGLGPQRVGSAEDAPVLGLIFPPSNRGIPEEGVAMYGDSLKFVVTGLGLDRMTPDADSLLVSCGGFRTLELIAPLESRTGVPVISSMPHGLWAGARLVWLSGAAPGYGRLLSMDSA